jgi:hypothetical protein
LNATIVDLNSERSRANVELHLKICTMSDAGENVGRRKTYVVFYWIVFVCLQASSSWAQEVPQVQLQATPRHTQSILPEAPIAKAPELDEKPPRLFWIIPTFSVSDSKAPTALSSQKKFRMFVNDSTDPFTIGYTAFAAGLSQANNDLPGYGQGAAGYAKRFGSGMADQSASSFFRTFLFPSLLHQDPRYFRKGSGPWRPRLAHTFIRPVVTNTDSQHKAFNWSGLLGELVTSALANTYYPKEQRGVGKTFSRVATSIPSSVIDHLIDEFGPDLQRKLTRKKEPAEQ